MERHGRWVRTRGRDQLPRLKVCEGALDGASGKPGGAGNRLMGPADRPVGLLGCLAVEVKVNHERGQPAVMPDQVGQKAVEQVRVKGYLDHKQPILHGNIVTENATCLNRIDLAFS
jgi:hypothetical protein